MVLLAWLAAGRAAAEECRSAADAVDKALCSDAAFRRADRAMSASYFDLLRSVGERDLRDALILSQRRWIAARKEGTVNVDDTPLEDRPSIERRSLIAVTRAREAQLKRKAPDGRTSAMIAILRHQRDVMSRFPGGPFQGFSTECDFLSPPFGSGYACFGTVAVQRGSRVCAHSLEWASGHTTDILVVARAEGDRLSQEAVCKDGYDENYPVCPHPDLSWMQPLPLRPSAVQIDEDARTRDRRMGWDRANSYDLDLGRYPLNRLDPEGDGIDRNVVFLKACTSQAAFPRHSIRKSLDAHPRPGLDLEHP